MTQKSDADDRVLVITRIFDAPRERVFAAWTNPERLARWMGPPEHPAVSVKADVRSGGAWRNCLCGRDDGRELWQGGVYREIAPPERLVFTFAWDRDDGTPGHEMLVAVTFEEHEGGKTRLTLRQTLFETVEKRDGHLYGWNGSLDRLDAYLHAA